MRARQRRSSRSRGNGYGIPDEWVIEDEGFSGATLLRPGLERLRDLAAEGCIQAVLIHAPDRLSRKYAYQVLLTEELARHGVETIFLKAPHSGTPEDQLMLQFQGMIAEYERAQILERSRRGKRHRAKAGEVSVLGGAPYGYRYTPKTRDTPARYEIDADEAEVVRCNGLATPRRSSAPEAAHEGPPRPPPRRRARGRIPGDRTDDRQRILHNPHPERRQRGVLPRVGRRQGHPETAERQDQPPLRAASEGKSGRDEEMSRANRTRRCSLSCPHCFPPLGPPPPSPRPASRRARSGRQFLASLPAVFYICSLKDPMRPPCLNLAVSHGASLRPPLGRGVADEPARRGAARRLRGDPGKSPAGRPEGWARLEPARRRPGGPCRGNRTHRKRLESRVSGAGASSAFAPVFHGARLPKWKAGPAADRASSPAHLPQGASPGARGGRRQLVRARRPWRLLVRNPLKMLDRGPGRGERGLVTL